MIKLRKFVLIIGDIILAYLSLLLTVMLGFWPDFSFPILWQHLLPFTILYFFWFIIFYIFGLYEFNTIRPKMELLVRIGESFAAVAAVGTAFFYLIPLFEITPKTNLLINIIVLALLLFFWRRVFFLFFSSIYRQSIAFLGRNSLADKLAKEFAANPHMGYKFSQFLSIRKPILPVLKKRKIDTLVVVSDIASHPKIAEQLYESLPLRIDLVDLPELYEKLFRKIPIDFINQNWFLRNLKEGSKKVYDKIKRIEDVILASLIIAITSPLWLIFYFLIKLQDKGPLFYKQVRVGRDKKEFLLWKFRSMKPDAEKNGARWAEKDDIRITKIGRFLRRSHLDELPQMLNVLKDDISLVGPRPERPEFVKKLEKQIPYYHLRHIIKPGFTGWAQINFRYARNVMDSHEKFQYDLYYIKNRSLILDLSCLLKTLYLFVKDS